MPTTAPNESGRPPKAVSDPDDEAAQARWEQGPMTIEKMPPDSSPPLPFVAWPVPPKDIGQVDT